MARVVRGLASVGYVGRWRVVRASDVGAPHGRARVFIVAWPAADTNNKGSHRHGLHRSSERRGPESANGNLDVADSDESGWQGPQPAQRQHVPSWRAASDAGGGPRRQQGLVGTAATTWGQYAAAIACWEHVLGRVAPSPTEPGTKGQSRLSPAFVEWLMGLPSGWVTDVPEVKRNAALKILGNGVVPQQVALALRLLLPMEAAA
jgi:DNA (cytosine-5)-methyltransferase 1